jgi:hypothetical protein
VVVSRVVVSRVVPPHLRRKVLPTVDRKLKMARPLLGVGPTLRAGSLTECRLKGRPEVLLRRAVTSQLVAISRVKVLRRRMRLVVRLMAENPDDKLVKTATSLPSRTRSLRPASLVAASLKIRRTRSRQNSLERGIKMVAVRPGLVFRAAHQRAVPPEGVVAAVTGATNRPTARMPVTLPQNLWLGRIKISPRFAEQPTLPFGIFATRFAQVTMRYSMNWAGIENKPKRSSSVGRRCGRQRQQVMLASESLSIHCVVSDYDLMVSGRLDRCRLGNADRRPRAVAPSRRSITESGSRPI